MAGVSLRLWSSANGDTAHSHFGSLAALRTDHLLSLTLTVISTQGRKDTVQRLLQCRWRWQNVLATNVELDPLYSATWSACSGLHKVCTCGMMNLQTWLLW